MSRFLLHRIHPRDPHFHRSKWGFPASLHCLQRASSCSTEGSALRNAVSTRCWTQTFYEQVTSAVSSLSLSPPIGQRPALGLAMGHPSASLCLLPFLHPPEIGAHKVRQRAMLRLLVDRGFTRRRSLEVHRRAAFVQVLNGHGALAGIAALRSQAGADGAGWCQPGGGAAEPRSRSD